ncbi:MAG TPA: putative toxin-antitoxin system toxin component, PIN family [Bacteroidales bacterium]|jgi:putative PIN family toxin of toxin-antitoxin system|nr:putative toxin-antitoxin system toxin component, PIN family [Bacteroidales bacterium]MDI9552804.1 putative toxin-antitoxin system toxin component, PIN family [Bacteroidota bacterium]MBP7037608.1 putative toxin-antitoxin system toxin component, PIN family [Bacteroidales bacterium]MZP66010.1 putative toxin-antitoxin system toxin component, PIN family [Bacteroidales bacterium]NLK55566.1 putative toxin-antitoxin system toxin component, PIN family [Bacteroidales bacterium]
MQNEVFILDSNIWISYLITRRLDKLVTLILNNQLIVLTCRQLIEEIQEVLLRPKFKKYIKPSDIKEFIAIHLKLCWIVDAGRTTNQLTDPKDNFLLDLYNKGKATILVTGDKKFLHEATELNYRVMTLKEFELNYA